MFFFFSSRRRHTRFDCDWSSDVCSSDLLALDQHVAQVCQEWQAQGQPAHSIQLLLDARDKTVVFDGEHLRRILVNLLDNARRYRSRSEEHTSESSHSQISYAVFCLKKKKKITNV